MLTHAQCRALESRFGSPFYLLDREAFVDNFRRLEAAFQRCHPRVVVGYSYKTNYIPHLCRLVQELGGRPEVVSQMEYDLAVRIGEDPSRIIFNGPVKQYDDIERALQDGATVNLDSFAEIEHACTFARRRPHLPVQVGLRVNMDLSDRDGASHVQDGFAISRFGLPPEAMPEAAALLRANSIRVHCLHGHASSSSRSAWIYERIARTLCRLAAEFFPDEVEFINVGGGFFGKMPPDFAPPGTPTFDDYAEAVGRALRDSSWAQSRPITLVVEPGIALVGNVLSFVTRVLEVKAVRGTRLAVVDGNIFNVKPSQHSRNQPFSVIAADDAVPAPEQLPLSVTGSTCMERDYLLRDVACSLQRGDYLRIDNVGAYTIVMTPPFIHPAPAIVSRQGDDYVLIRRRQTFDDVFGAYTS